ncbi:MAG: ATP-dependent DNA helicase [Eubacteriales bacterium]|nr:ATP-dependent DNA helicase [Eubacteriales bacterium]
MYVISENTLRISVRNLVEFVLREGNIDNRTGGLADVKLMQEGAKMHKKIQKSMGSAYNAEVSLRLVIPMESPEHIPYEIKLEGRADGIIADMQEDEAGNKIPVSDVTIDEIKTVQTDVEKMNAPVEVHKAQACVYGYIVAAQKNLKSISVQMTYCNPETEKIKRFKEEYTFEQINQWFYSLMDKFTRWSDFIFEERAKRQASIKKLSFPFDYREGQKSLVVSVYKTIESGGNLYIQAPTGVGKTISTVFPAVAAMGQEYIDKIFYLTSKTITRTVAEETFDILRQNGLKIRTVTLTARDKICHLKERDCNPAACEYADGHYDRVNDAVYDLVTHEAVINRDKIYEYSVKHKVCPFEMSLDVSYWCDGIICDYNYVFDPNASLKRYFGDGSKGDYVFLVDEAHNLVDRARSMYSAVLMKEDFLAVKRIMKDKDSKLASSLEKCNKELLEYKRLCDTYRELENMGRFPMWLERCMNNISAYIDKHKNQHMPEELMDLFFKIRHFLNMYDCMDEKYVIYTEHDAAGNFLMHLYCVDPSGNIGERLAQGRCTVFFSATLLPVNYYKDMLSGSREDKAVYANSPFDTVNRRIIVGTDVSSRYTRRNRNEYLKICKYIHETVKVHQGNYMVFFPSYQYMETVFLLYMEMYPSNEIKLSDLSYDAHELDLLMSDGENVLMQRAAMKEAEKEAFLNTFTNIKEGREKSSLVGFCVTGGIFSEGIDLKEDSLVGVLIVGTGLPMICRQRNILRDYFDRNGIDGYAYSYVYPGMNKVLQAAGRVIRTDSDRGVILLLDDRFSDREYERLFPREWNEVYPSTKENVGKIVGDFWK